MTLLSYLFGCRHNRYTFPVTLKPKDRPQAAGYTGTYVACLDCGKELPYDFKEMKVIKNKKKFMQTLKGEYENPS